MQVLLYRLEWKTKTKEKTGFQLKKDALNWERDFLQNHTAVPETTMSTVCDKYLELKKVE